MSETAEEPENEGYQRFDCTVDDLDLIAAASEAAREAIERGECVVLPTDTVYGIGADAFNAEAVQRLLDAKQRGRDMPPPVLIGDASLIRALATEVPDLARELVEKHWPGPLTVICKIQPSLRMDLGETEGSIALRVPDHDLTREILRRTGPMAVSSANLSGQSAALTCDEAVAQLGDSVAVYLDGGAVGGATGAPSTIVDFTQSDDGEIRAARRAERRGAARNAAGRRGPHHAAGGGFDKPEDGSRQAQRAALRQAQRRGRLFDELRGRAQRTGTRARLRLIRIEPDLFSGDR